MGYTPYYIANYEEDSGLETLHEPFLLPEKAFPLLDDAYVWRGRVKRRLGFQHLGRLRLVLTGRALGNTGASPWAFNIFTILGIVGEPNAEIQVGSVVITIAGPIVFTDNSDGTLTSLTPGNSGTINYETWDVVLTHTAGPGVAVTIDFSYYPNLPVMGLPNQQTTQINENNLIAFDEKYAYRFNAGQFERLPSTLPVTWNSNDEEFFWCLNYGKVNNNIVLWETNFHPTDPMYYWDTITWTLFAPILRPDFAVNPTRLQQARILIGYKERLIVMNTYEGRTIATATNFPNRIRFSADAFQMFNQGAVGPGPAWTTVSDWADDVPGRGGFIDLPTTEQIITAEFIHDVLLIKTERQSWKLIFTGNKNLPFYYERINRFFGCESTFSIVPFDHGVLAVGNYGLTIDDSVNVVRIDDRIPDTVLSFNNDAGSVKRVHGIKDYGEQVVYWNYPSVYTGSATGTVFPDKMLVYNYKNNTFATFNDSFTCFGYFQFASDETWSELNYLTWNDWNRAWDAGSAQSQYPHVCAGNQQGYVSVLNQGTYNDFSLSVTNINSGVSPTVFTIPNHNLKTGRFIELTDIISGLVPDYTTLNSHVFKVQALTADTMNLIQDDGNFVDFGVAGNYIGNGKATVLNNINITTKTFAPYYEAGSQVRVGYLDFLLDKTTNGEVSVNFNIDECTSLPINIDSASVDGNLGSNVLYTKPENLTLIPFQANQSKILHRVYIQSISQNFSINITMTDQQMFSKAINSSAFTMHAMVIYLSKNARLVQ